MTTNREILVKVEMLKNILVDRAIGQHRDEDSDDYIELRRELVQNTQIQPYLPTFVLSCRNLKEFWSFIQPKFSKYAERRGYLRDQFDPLLTYLELGSATIGTASPVEDLFKYQFPAGLPFGLTKPSLAVIPQQGSQMMRFEDNPNIGVIRENVYPNFSAPHLKEMFQGKTIAGLALIPALLKMNTESEKKLLRAYASEYHMWSSENVPVLIPQVWIQWHSMTKSNLRARKSSYADDLYRVDFVAFWNSQRFAILVDDISHYAKKINERWDADEASYSKRLKEDRKLRKEGWQVFRVSNWEMRNAGAISEILADLREFVGF